MPMKKKVRSLEALCLQNVAQNVDKHSVAWKRAQSQEEKLSYLAFQRRFSHRLFQSLVDLQWFSVMYESRETKSKCKTRKKHKIIELCLDFIFNSQLEEIIKCENVVKYSTYYYFEIIKTIQRNCKKISRVELCRLHILEREFVSLLQHSFTNVVHLNIRMSRCTNLTISALLKYCHNLKHLDISYTWISDEQLMLLCSSESNSATVNKDSLKYCPNPEKCTNGLKLTSLYITGNFMTTTGLVCILQHIPSLRVLRYNRRNTYNGHSVPQALSVLYNNGFVKDSVGSEWLEELRFISDCNPSQNLEHALAFLPKLKKLKWETNLSVKDFALFKKFTCLRDLTLPLEDANLFASEELKKFFILRGRQLTALKIYGVEHNQVPLARILDTVNTCPNLKQLHFESIHLASLAIHQLEIYEDAPLSSIPLPKFYIQLTNLENIIFSDIRVCRITSATFLSAILTKAENLKYMQISSYYNLRDEAFFSALKQHAFYKLRELLLRNCLLSGNLLKQFVCRENNLEKLVCGACTNVTDHQRKEIQSYAVNNNLDIKLVLEE